MKKISVRIISILIAAIMVMSLSGCRMEETDSRSLKPEPTPEITLDDLLDVQKENTAKYVDLVKNTLSQQSFELPDMSATMGMGLKCSFDLMGSYVGTINLNCNADCKSASNIAHLILDVAAEAGLEGAEVNKNQANVEMYIDNTGKDDTIRIYQKEDNGRWTVSEQQLSDMLNQADAETNDENTDQKQYFKDFEEFLKNHTTMETEPDVYRTTSTFTLQELHEYYKVDFDSMMDDFSNIMYEYAGVLTGISGADMTGYDMSGVIGTLVGAVRECVSGMTGDVRLVQEYDAELQPTLMKLTLNNVVFASQADFKMKFAFEELSINILNRNEKENVTIPDEVKNGAVSEVSGF